MTEISLRAYCDKVEELIKTDSHDQAIAICQHILRIYPKYLEAYRLLGQACLEKGMHSEAEDFFNRVLSAHSCENGQSGDLKVDTRKNRTEIEKRIDSLDDPYDPIAAF